MSHSGPGVDYRLDEIDRRIVHALMVDARNTSSPTIAEAVNVSSATVRNRIGRLEDAGIIRGYTALVDFERANGRLTNLYICTVPVSERESLAQEVRAIPGVVNVRELMTGRRNLHVMAVGEDTGGLRRIARGLSKLGVELEDENLVQNESHSPYVPFGPDEKPLAQAPTDFISLAGEANVVEITVRNDAPISGQTIAAAAEGTLDPETLVIAIERGEKVLTPRGETVLCADDVVTLLFRGGDTGDVLDAFGANTELVDR